MKWCVIDDKGCIYQIGNSGGELTAADFLHITSGVLLDIPDDVSDSTHYYRDDAFHLFGECPDKYSIWDWISYSWIPDPGALGRAKEVKKSAARKQCQNDIVSNYTSLVLGELHTYSGSVTEQANLTAAVNASLASGPSWAAHLWCADTTGYWSLKTHTANQVQALNLEWVNRIAGIRQEYFNTLSVIELCSTIPALEAIN